MGQHRVDRLAPAVDDVEDAVGQARLRPQLGLELGRAGCVRRRLPDERVPAGKGDRVDPHRDHRREVERGDPGRDAERLAEGQGVDLGRHVRRVHPGQVDRQPAGVLDGLEATQDLGQRVRRGLAVVARDEAGELLAVSPDELAIGEEDLAAADQGQVAPGRERGPGGGDGAIDVGGATPGDPGDDVAGRRVVDRLRLRRRRPVDPSVDPVGDDRERRGLGRLPLRECGRRHRLVPPRGRRGRGRRVSWIDREPGRPRRASPTQWID